MKTKFKKFLIDNFGKYLIYLRLPSVGRILSDRELNRIYKRLKPGRVLFIGASWKEYYKKIIPHKEFLTLDVDDTFNPDILGDVHRMKIKNEEFDTVVITRVLEHCVNPKKAISEVHRILKKGGIAVFSSPFIYPYHASPHDYYRLSHEAYQDLLGDFSKIKIIPYGNRLQLIWMLLSQGFFLKFILTFFNYPISWLDYKSKKFIIGYVAYAVK